MILFRRYLLKNRSEQGDSTGISGKVDALVVGDAYSADEFTSAIDIELVLVDDEEDE